MLLLAAHCAPVAGNATDGTNIEDTPWVLVRFTTGDESLPTPETFTPTLTLEDGHYIFDAGCNSVNGEYELQDSLPEIVGTIAQHLIYCGDEPGGKEAMALEDAFAEALLSWSDQRIVDDEWHIAYEGGELVFTRELSE